jgi:hypothetical protein
VGIIRHSLLCKAKCAGHSVKPYKAENYSTSGPPVFFGLVSMTQNVFAQKTVPDDSAKGIGSCGLAAD